MSRRILCEKCGVLKPMHPEDVATGWQRRCVNIWAKKPAVHEVKFTANDKTETITLPSLVCDDCGTPIKDGDAAVAVTMWRGNDEPYNWEKDYEQH